MDCTKICVTPFDVEEALKEIKVATTLWLETARKEGRKIPEPHGKELLNVLYSTFGTPEPQKTGS